MLLGLFIVFLLVIIMGYFGIITIDQAVWSILFVVITYLSLMCTDVIGSYFNWW